MPELTREEKLKLIEKLPQKLQDFLYSEDTGAFLLYFGKKYNLPDEKILALSKIVSDIILKITPITSLAQEIVNKVISDPQMAMIIAQELNGELLMPALMPTPAVPVEPAPSPIPAPAATPLPAAPIPTPRVGTPTPAERGVGADQYREPTAEGLGIIDLRKTPTPPMPMPVAPAPIPPRPLTFTKPVEPIKPTVQMPMPTAPLIEAQPHKVEPRVEPPAVSPSTPLGASRVEPQYIIRPPGLAPTPTPRVGAPTPVERGVGADLPHDVLDLRKDKGEF